MYQEQQPPPPIISELKLMKTLCFVMEDQSTNKQNEEKKRAS